MKKKFHSKNEKLKCLKYYINVTRIKKNSFGSGDGITANVLAKFKIWKTILGRPNGLVFCVHQWVNTVFFVHAIYTKIGKYI